MAAAYSFAPARSHYQAPETYIPRTIAFDTSTKLPPSQQSLNPPNTMPQSNLSNTPLSDLLRRMQEELTTHRSMITNIQLRLSSLERGLDIEAPVIAPCNTRTSHVTKPQPTRYYSHTSSVEQIARQDFAPRDNPAFNTNKFLSSPRRFSGFQFDFASLDMFPKTPSVAPDIGNVPGLTPTSVKSGQSDIDTVGSRETKPRYSVFPPPTKNKQMFQMRKEYALHGRPSQKQTNEHTSTSESLNASHNIIKDVTSKFNTQRATTRDDSRSKDDIVEQIVSADTMKRPKPPILQSPPQSRKSTPPAVGLGHEITALPVMPPREPSLREPTNQHRYSRSIRSILGSKTAMKRSSCVQGQ